MRCHCCGMIRDRVTQQRRPFLRFFACEHDHEPPDAPLPDAVASGAEPFWIVGAIAGGVAWLEWRQTKYMQLRRGSEELSGAIRLVCLAVSHRKTNRTRQNESRRKDESRRIGPFKTNQASEWPLRPETTRNAH